MQYLGNIADKQKAEAEALRIAKEENKTVVLEKAKRKEGTHRYVTYRAWLICSSSEAKVITMTEWQQLPEDKKH